MDIELKCEKCQSDDLFFVAAGDAVMVACKRCGHVSSKALTPEVKAAIRRKMAPVDPWQGE